MMVRQGFQKVFVTDINPNAMIGLTESIEETKLAGKTQLDFGYLFDKWKKPTALIVYHSLWLPARQTFNRKHDAIYYNEQLYPEFFDAAHKRPRRDGKIVILFSNVAQIRQP